MRAFVKIRMRLAVRLSKSLLSPSPPMSSATHLTAGFVHHPLARVVIAVTEKQLACII